MDLHALQARKISKLTGGTSRASAVPMQRAPSAFVKRLLPSMTDLAFLMPLVFLFCGMRGAQTLLSDGDTGWHLRTGEWILAHGQVPDRDIFSFTRSGQPWFAWEWLWDVLFGWLHLKTGLAGVVLASSLVLALTFALLFRLARRRGDALVALALTLVAAGASAGHWLARPHLFTMLFVVVFYTILELRKAGPWLWALPPLMVLWTNLHGGFFVGILLIGAYAAGEFACLLRRVSNSRRQAAIRRGRRYLLAAGACGLATFVNPYGWRLHAHIVRYLADGFYRGNIMEFQSLNFQSGQARYLEILLLAGAAAAFVHLRRGRLTWPLLFAVWAHLALFSARNIEIFVLLAAVPAAEVLSAGLRSTPAPAWSDWFRRLWRGFSAFTRDWNAFDHGVRWPVSSMAGVMLLGALLYAPQPPRGCRAGHDPHAFPVAAEIQLEKAGLFSGVFTEDLWGGYLIYRQYPRGHVFIDGRSDFYGPRFAGSYIQAMGAQSGWEQYLGRYGVDTVMLPPDAPLAGALRQSAKWHLIYDDGVALIFRSTPVPSIRLPQGSADPPGFGIQTATTYQKGDVIQ